MQSQKLKNVWSLILLFIFLSSTYLCYSFGVQTSKYTEESSAGGKFDMGDSESTSVSTSLTSGYNGAATGFGVIAGSSLVSLTLLFSSSQSRKESD